MSASILVHHCFVMIGSSKTHTHTQLNTDLQQVHAEAYTAVGCSSIFFPFFYHLYMKNDVLLQKYNSKK